jgi:hypothetical protein
MQWFRIPSIGLLALLIVSGAAAQGPFAAGTWTRAKNAPPSAVGHPLLLTDGSVLINSFFFSSHADPWYRLVPDNTGSYVHGTWYKAGVLPSGYNPLYFASQVLPSGQVAIFGGEYNNGNLQWTAFGALYTPASNKWTRLSAPSGWGTIGDAESILLPNGKMMLANCCTSDEAILTLTGEVAGWTPTGAGKADSNDEEGWTLLPGNQILTVNAYANGGCCAKGFQIYSPTTGKWTTPAGNTVVNLVDRNSAEIGPLALLPNGHVFAGGGTTNNAIYTLATGTWAKAPGFGSGLDMADGPAAVLPDGNLLLDTSPGVYNNGSVFFEWDGKALHRTAASRNALIDSSYVGNMLVLPTGQILFTDLTSLVQFYTPAGNPCAGCAPMITSVSGILTQGSLNNLIKGRQFTGVTQGAYYGDDSQSYTNYPLVRIIDNAGHVVYCRTHNWVPSVATGTKIVATQFDIPSTIALGPATLEVVVNGIASAPVSVTID